MKKTTIYMMALLMLGIGTLSTGCLGSFSLSGKLLNWNKNVTGSRFLNNLLFYAFAGLQVYTFTLAADVIVLNLIEFWTGSNPAAMNEGEKEQQIVRGNDGQMYEITATRNRFDVRQLTGEKSDRVQSLLLDPSAGSCSMLIDGVETKLVSCDAKTGVLSFFKPDGSVMIANASASPEQIQSMLQAEIVTASSK